MGLGVGLAGLTGTGTAGSAPPPPPGLAAIERLVDARGSASALVVLATPYGLDTAQHQIASELGGTGARVTRAYDIAPALAVTVTPAALDVLADAPGVLGVVPDFQLSLALSDSTEIVGATETAAAGDDGTGRAIAIIDGGVDRNHSFFDAYVNAPSPVPGDKIVAEACFAQGATAGDAAGACPGGTTTKFGLGAATPHCALDTAICRHGTHVAGIAAGHGAAYDGVAPDASIVAIQVFDPAGSAWLSDLLAALEYVESLSASVDIAAANMSLAVAGQKHVGADCDAFDGAEVDPLKSVIDRLRAGGIPTVVASGNDGFADGLSYPACISSAISVGATDDSDAVASFSNSSEALELWAPGVGIVSSLPGNRTGAMTGTSMATPHVAGALAVLDEHFPSISVDEKLQWLIIHAPPATRGALSKPRLDLHDLNVSAPSNAPTSIVATAGDAEATVSWVAPDGSAPTHYVVTAIPGSRSVRVKATKTTAKVTKLSNGASHTFEVRAQFGAQLGAPGVSNATTPVSSVKGADVSAKEGSAANSVPITIKMKRTSTAPVTVHLQTFDGVTTDGQVGAIAGEDYVQKTWSVIIAPGNREYPTSVVLLGDTTKELTERFFVRMTGADGATITDAEIKVTIKNDD
ncbi:MAG: S8 family serine peptidase [Actinomycetota bacterium]